MIMEERVNEIWYKMSMKQISSEEARLQVLALLAPTLEDGRMKPIEQMSINECLWVICNPMEVTLDYTMTEILKQIADRIYDLTRWIPVEERMPDDVFDYVHVHYDGMIGTMCYSKEKGFFGATANRMEMFAHAITHWRRIDTPEGV